jgi:hypothetical protein
MHRIHSETLRITEYSSLQWFTVEGIRLANIFHGTFQGKWLTNLDNEHVGRLDRLLNEMSNLECIWMLLEIPGSLVLPCSLPTSRQAR